MTARKIILTVILVAAATTAVLSFKWRSGGDLTKITVTGNYTVQREEILRAARLNDTATSWDEINIDNIRDRILKNPEVKKVYVSKEMPSELEIEILERRPIAILNGENEIRLVDEELETFPFRNSSKMYDLPVISGVRIEQSPKGAKNYSHEDLRLAVFMILNIYSTSKMIYNNVSEVNLSDSTMAVVYLSEDSSPFYFPRRYHESISNIDYRNEVTGSIAIFENYLQQYLDVHLKKHVNYVDVRFGNQVIVNSNN